MVDRIKHERIPLKRRARVYIGDSDDPSFEMHCFSRDLSISGIFLNTECLLRIDKDVKIDLEVHPEEWLALNGLVARRIEFGDREHPPGFGVAFGELSDRSHETLLRYFLTDKVVAFYQIFLKRFPHLRDELSEQDAALIVNLWEDNRHALVDEHHSNAPVTTPPRIFELPSGRSAAPPSRAAPKPVAPARPVAPAKPVVPPKPVVAAKPVVQAKPAIAKPAPVVVKPIAVAKPAAPAPKTPVKAPVPAKPAPKAAAPAAAKKRPKSR